MGGLLGPVGGLEEIRCVSRLDVAAATESVLSVRQALDFATEHAQIRAGRPSRVWSLAVGSSEPHTLSMLAELEQLQRVNRRALVYYPEHSLLDNILDPEASFMAASRWSGVGMNGARTLPLNHPTQRFIHSGRSPSDGSWARLEGVPVPFGREVTVAVTLSARAGQTARLRVIEAGMDGKPLGDREVSSSEVLKRVHLSFTTSVQVASLTLAVSGADTIAHPQVTLTPGPRPWVPGQGCRSALVVAPPSQAVQTAIPGVGWGRRSAFEWQIREVQGSYAAPVM